MGQSWTLSWSCACRDSFQWNQQVLYYITSYCKKYCGQCYDPIALKVFRSFALQMERSRSWDFCPSESHTRGQKDGLTRAGRGRRVQRGSEVVVLTHTQHRTFFFSLAVRRTRETLLLPWRHLVGSRRTGWRERTQREEPVTGMNHLQPEKRVKRGFRPY